MATDFEKNALVSSGGLKPSSKDTPGDIRVRINTIADMELIPLPYVGMMVYVVDEEKYYVQLQYVGNANDYIGQDNNANKVSFFKTTFEIEVDRIKPMYNLTKLMSLDKYVYNSNKTNIDFFLQIYDNIYFSHIVILLRNAIRPYFFICWLLFPFFCFKEYIFSGLKPNCSAKYVVK
jgi:hypothetical protein